MKGPFVIGPGVSDAGKSDDTDSSDCGKRWEFHTKNRIGHGSFGSIYLGEWRSSAGCRAAPRRRAARATAREVRDLILFSSKTQGATSTRARRWR